MKKILSTFAIFLLFAVGCNDQTNITSPDNNSSIVENPTLEKPVTVSKVINGDTGGFIILGNFEGAQKGECVYSAVCFQAGSFSGTKTITITLDPKKLSGTFEPGMVFNKPVLFSALFTNLNLKGVDVSNFDFVYVAPNGQQTTMPSSFLYFNKEKGVVGILGAQLPHFSRYIFVRKS
ncbi:MAG TPA: hypothetical protein PLT78_00745 [Ignavibacteriaceae bacterium]|nr:hypothetical protein [Ignavibacteriaceae bacterium]